MIPVPTDLIATIIDKGHDFGSQLWDVLWPWGGVLIGITMAFIFAGEIINLFQDLFSKLFIKFSRHSDANVETYAKNHGWDKN